MFDRKLSQKLQDIYSRSHVQVDVNSKQIQVFWMHDCRGLIWVPYGGGPLYRDQAKDEARWLRKHIEEFRSLLPKKVRDWPVVLGELDTRTFPGVFTPREE